MAVPFTARRNVFEPRGDGSAVHIELDRQCGYRPSFRRHRHKDSGLSGGGTSEKFPVTSEPLRWRITRFSREPGALTTEPVHAANVTDPIRVVGSNASRGVADVRFLADFVRFTPESGHSRQARQCPLIANNSRSAKANI